MDNGNFYSKKGQRKLSSFVGQELLYDYISEQLDPERQKAVEEFLKENREAQGDVQKINNGISYVGRLAETVVSQALLEKIETPSNYFQTVQARLRFEEWPVGLKLGLEAMVVALGITSVAVLVPWHKIMSLRTHSENVVLTEVAHETVKKTTEVETGDAVKEQPAAFQDEGVVVSKPNIVDENEVSKSNTPAPAPTAKTATVAAVAPATPPPVTPAAPEVKKTAVAAAATATDTTEKDGKHVGFLYRGSMSVTNVSAVAPKMVEKLAALGSRKAGEVELGWKKGNGSYFHFTVPESKYEEVLAVFNEYGQLKIQKERHERVMPEGIIRLIITVDEKKSKQTEKAPEKEVAPNSSGPSDSEQ
jgi:hypothetical protein